MDLKEKWAPAGSWTAGTHFVHGIKACIIHTMPLSVAQVLWTSSNQLQAVRQIIMSSLKKWWEVTEFSLLEANGHHDRRKSSTRLLKSLYFSEEIKQNKTKQNLSSLWSKWPKKLVRGQNSPMKFPKRHIPTKANKTSEQESNYVGCR